ncbi:MAG: hypothetical protein H9893_05370 [Candidatus Niameybacter stercoravium]|nr:hypothetical protein [Candidatus Niameybacter stercoravium]
MRAGSYIDAPDSSIYFVEGPKGKGYGRGIRDKRYTFILSAADGKQRCILYDRQEDPYQMKDIIEDNKGLARTYLEKLKIWLQEIDDPFEIKIQL